jgi:hypothetical protein
MNAVGSLSAELTVCTERARNSLSMRNGESRMGVARAKRYSFSKYVPYQLCNAPMYQHLNGLEEAIQVFAAMQFSAVQI